MFDDMDLFYIDSIIASIMDMKAQGLEDFFDDWEEEQEVLQWLYDRRAGVNLWELSDTAAGEIAFIITHYINDNMMAHLEWFMKARKIPVNTAEEIKLLESIAMKRKGETSNQ